MQNVDNLQGFGLALDSVPIRLRSGQALRGNDNGRMNKDENDTFNAGESRARRLKRL